MRLAVVATPKSGNHWLKALLAETYGLSVVPSDVIADRSNAICHDHLLPDIECLKWLSDNDIRPVTIFRHPVDVLVSLYHFVWMKQAPLPEEQSILRDVGSIGEGTLDYARIHLFPLLMCSDLWRAAGIPYVRYEDLVEDPVSTMRSLTRSLRPVPEEAIRRAVVLSRFSLKRDAYRPGPDVKAESNFYRRGGTGYHDELSPELMALLATDPFAAYMRDLGYELCMEPVKPFDVDRLDPFEGRASFSNGVRIGPKCLKLFLTSSELTRWRRPWKAGGDKSFFSWLNAPEYPGASLTNLMRLIYADRRDLQAAFPDVDTAPYGFQVWFLRMAAKEYELAPDFLAQARALIAGRCHHGPDKQRVETSGRLPQPGVSQDSDGLE